jgi:hypothetical protein
MEFPTGTVDVGFTLVRGGEFYSGAMGILRPAVTSCLNRFRKARPQGRVWSGAIDSVFGHNLAKPSLARGVGRATCQSVAVAGGTTAIFCSRFSALLSQYAKSSKTFSESYHDVDDRPASTYQYLGLVVARCPVRHARCVLQHVEVGAVGGFSCYQNGRRTTGASSFPSYVAASLPNERSAWSRHNSQHQ